jgi:adenylosuccinate lyase
MKANMAKTADLVCSQRVVVALTKKGLPKQKAYELVQAHALRAWTAGVPFRPAVEADGAIRSKLGARELDACFDLAPFHRHTRAILRRVLTAPPTRRRRVF